MDEINAPGENYAEKLEKVTGADGISGTFKFVKCPYCQSSQVSIQGDGTVLVDSAELEEPYLQTKSLGQCNTAFPCHVRSGYVFVMGDNREVAMDSRLTEIGTIPEARIIGKVLFVI